MTISEAEINSKHHQAMELASAALVLQRSEDSSGALNKFRQAFLLERDAADGVADSTIEPSRSVLHRSAAELVLDCGETAEAARLALRGLNGTPPAEMAVELRDVLARAESASPTGLPPQQP